MKATFALLANTEVYNVVRKLALEIHRYRTGTLHVRLPPHISLKQPFAIANLAQLEAYMAELAETISPFTVKLTHLQLKMVRFQEMEFGILWLDVEGKQTNCANCTTASTASWRNGLAIPRPPSMGQTIIST